MTAKKLGLIFLLIGIFLWIVFFFRIFHKPSPPVLISPSPVSVSPSPTPSPPPKGREFFETYFAEPEDFEGDFFSQKFEPPLALKSREYQEMVSKINENFSSQIYLPKLDFYSLSEIAIGKTEDLKFVSLLYLREKGAVLLYISNYFSLSETEEKAEDLQLKNGKKATLYKYPFEEGLEMKSLFFSPDEKLYYTLSTFEGSVEDLKEFADSLLE
jgi:hypothetical protein